MLAEGRHQAFPGARCTPAVPPVPAVLPTAAFRPFETITASPADRPHNRLPTLATNAPVRPEADLHDRLYERAGSATKRSSGEGVDCATLTDIGPLLDRARNWCSLY